VTTGSGSHEPRRIHDCIGTRAVAAGDAVTSHAPVSPTEVTATCGSVFVRAFRADGINFLDRPVLGVAIGAFHRASSEVGSRLRTKKFSEFRGDICGAAARSLPPNPRVLTTPRLSNRLGKQIPAKPLPQSPTERKALSKCLQ
jgi:hypothetical protein